MTHWAAEVSTDRDTDPEENLKLLPCGAMALRIAAFLEVRRQAGAFQP